MNPALNPQRTAIRGLLTARDYAGALALARSYGWTWKDAEVELRKALAVQKPEWTVANVCLAITEGVLGGIPRSESCASR